MQAARFHVDKGQVEGAEVHLSQALAHQDSLEACLGKAEGSNDAETVLNLLFSLLLERLKNAWTLKQSVRPPVSAAVPIYSSDTSHSSCTNPAKTTEQSILKRLRLCRQSSL